MELRLDFYSAQEVSVRIDLTSKNLSLEDGVKELFMFAAFTFRQFSNFGNHPVAMLLAALLTTFDKGALNDLASGMYAFPDGVQLDYLLASKNVRIGIDHQMLHDQIMPGLPELVEFRGEGKKAFIATIPPLNLRTKGFGLLGFQVNYYAFHATIALLRHLAQKHRNDPVYLDRLSNVAAYCGRTHLSTGVSMGDQAARATALLEDLGIM